MLIIDLLSLSQPCRMLICICHLLRLCLYVLQAAAVFYPNSQFVQLLLPSTASQLQDAIDTALHQLSNSSRVAPKAPAVVVVLLAEFGINSSSQGSGVLTVDEPLLIEHPELSLVITTEAALLAAAMAAAEEPSPATTAASATTPAVKAAAPVAPEDMVQVQCGQLKQPWQAGGFMTAR